MGRPSLKSDAIIEAICLRLAQGEPLAQICQDEAMPSFGTVWRWENEDEVFRELSARARETGTHFMADDCIRIADDPVLEPNDKRIRIDTRMRLIGKWNAKKYGEAALLKLGDANGDKIPLDDTSKFTRLAAMVTAIQGLAHEPTDDAG